MISYNHFITISEIAMEMKLFLVLHTPLLQKSWTVEKSARWITMKVVQKVRAGWTKKKTKYCKPTFF